MLAAKNKTITIQDNFYPQGIYFLLWKLYKATDNQKAVINAVLSTENVSTVFYVGYGEISKLVWAHEGLQLRGMNMAG